jgi:branched-chain amino acid transport system permease protein
VSFFISQIPIAALFVVVAMGLDLAAGSAGLLNVAQVGLMGLGAYATGALTVKEGWPFIATVLAGMAVAAVVGALASLPGIRVRGFVYGVLSFAFAIVLYTAFNAQNPITNGSEGIVGVPAPNALGASIQSETGYAVVYGIIAIVVFAWRWHVGRSSFGLVLRTVRADPLVGAISGVNARLVLMQTMAVSAALAALGGSMYAGLIRFVDPSAFTVEEGFVLLVMVILGGQGNAVGAALGAIIISVIPGVMSYLPLGASDVGALSQIIYGVGLLVILRVRPGGLAPERGWLRGRSEGTASLDMSRGAAE